MPAQAAANEVGGRVLEEGDRQHQDVTQAAPDSIPSLGERVRG